MITNGEITNGKGSRPRCLLLTDGAKEEVAERLTSLVRAPDVRVTARDMWMPYGKPIQGEDRSWDKKPAKEATLTELTNLLCRIKEDTEKGKEIGDQIGEWWLVRRKRAQTPNWDIASTCTIERKPGLLLVEAKAHVRELPPEDASGASFPNRRRIGRAIDLAAAELEQATNGVWRLSRDRKYQLSNRFAWSWKLASLGVPVVLVYLGFLNAKEMVSKEDTYFTDEGHQECCSGGRPQQASKEDTYFTDKGHWECILKNYAKDVVDNSCWEQRIDVGGTPFLPLIRSCEQPLH